MFYVATAIPAIILVGIARISDFIAEPTRRLGAVTRIDIHFISDRIIGSLVKYSNLEARFFQFQINVNSGCRSTISAFWIKQKFQLATVINK